MKKMSLFFLIISFTIFVNAQNVGIGTNTPSQKLDVNGNMNVSGNISVNNVAGQPNQVLMTNNSGNTFWGNYCDFKYSRSFQSTAAGQTWTVPAGVTKIMIEIWGGGGGGAAGGGGGSGAYSQVVENVTPGNIVNITVGSGGLGAADEVSSGSAGTASQTSGAVASYASPGLGASTVSPGIGGNNAFSIFLFVYGNNGNPTIETYAQRGATEFVTIRKYGDGGKAVMLNGNEGTGAAFTFNTVTLANISLITSLRGVAAGAGGGGGPNNGSLWGSAGSDGLVIIHY